MHRDGLQGNFGVKYAINSEAWTKKERERKKQQKRKEKLGKNLEKKQVNKDASSLESMLAYVDENGNLSYRSGQGK